MTERLLALIVDEGKWLTASMSLAFLAVAILSWRLRRSGLSRRRRVTAAMNLFFGLMIGTMAFGHLLAVTTKLAMGTLKGSIPVLYAIGIALAIPAWYVVRHSFRLLESEDGLGRATLALNGWLAIALLGLGLHNLPLAAPAIFNVGYQLHSRRLVGWVMAGGAIVFSVALFIASLVFLASGQSFEQFSGMSP